MTRADHITRVADAAMAALQDVPQEMRADVVVAAGQRLEVFGQTIRAVRRDKVSTTTATEHGTHAE